MLTATLRPPDPRILTLDGELSLGDKGLSRRLVGVGAVAELHLLDTGRRLGLATELSVLLAEVVRDGGVVLSGHLKCLEGETPAGLNGDLLLLLELLKHDLVVGGSGDDGDATMVLGRGTEERDTSDVNLLNGAREGAVGGLNGLDERVEVAGDDGDGRDRVGREVCKVGRDVAREDAWRKTEGETEPSTLSASPAAVLPPSSFKRGGEGRGGSPP